MTPLNTHQMAIALIGAVMAFKWKYDADLEAQEADVSLMSEEQKQAAAAELIPVELEEEEVWASFATFVEHEGLGKFLKPGNPDFSCVAKLAEGEPSFTLMARDVTASILVEHWIRLVSAFSPDVRQRKIDHAEGIRESMESYPPELQKWPD